MTRSTWKGPFYEEYLLKKAEAVKNSGKTNQVIKIWTRRTTILPEFVGLTFGVYNGNKFIPVLLLIAIGTLATYKALVFLFLRTATNSL